MNGIVNNVIILFIEVKIIERATLPLKKYVITPDVVPPGQAARIINPILKGSDIFDNNETRKASSGSIIICEDRPINKGLGNKNRFLKLLVVNDKPTPSIINARIKLNNISRNVYVGRPIIAIFKV
jgi:hypothetical protein